MGKKKAIVQFGLDGVRIAEYESGAEAERRLGILQQNINSNIKGKIKQAGGYQWKYKEDMEGIDRIKEYDATVRRASKSVVQFGLDGVRIAEYESLGEAARSIGISTISIYKNINGKRKRAGKYQWRFAKDVKGIDRIEEYVSTREKAIVQFGLDGLRIAEYESIGEAARRLEISKTGIGQNSKGEKKQAGGYQWRFKEDVEGVDRIEEYDATVRRASKSVVQFGLDGVRIEEYESAMVASEVNNIDLSNIRKNIKGKIKSAGGYQWKLKEDMEGIDRIELYK